MFDPRSKYYLPTMLLIISLVGALVAWGVIRVIGNDADGGQPVASLPAVRSDDGMVWLDIPDDGKTGDPTVTFTAAPQERQRLNATMKGVSALRDPVDIQASGGALLPKKVKVTFAYKSEELPPGVTPTNLGLAMFDAKLDMWIPLLNSQVNEKARTVSAVAPHFSVFDMVFLDPAKKFVNVGDRVVDTVVNGAVSIAQWFGNLLKELTLNAIKDLTGTAPKLECKNKSEELTVKTESIFSRLTGCVDKADRGEAKLRLRNGYGFPILSDRLPKGVDMWFDDIFLNSNDVVTLMRSFYWAIGNRAAVPAAYLGSVVVTPKAPKTSKLTFTLDSRAVMFDMVMAAMMVLAPEGALAKAAVAKSMRTFLATGKKTLDKADGDFVQAMWDALDCTMGAGRDIPDSVFSVESYRWAANVVQGCMTTMLEQFHLESALNELVGTLKVIPAVVQSELADTVQMLSLGKINTKQFTATVSRVNPLDKFVGTWKAGVVNGMYTVVIKPGYKTGAETLADRYCKDGRICYRHSTFEFKPSGKKLIGKYNIVEFIDSAGEPPFDVGIEAELDGQLFVLEMVETGLLKRTMVDSYYSGLLDNEYLCGKGASKASLAKCRIK